MNERFDAIAAESLTLLKGELNEHDVIGAVKALRYINYMITLASDLGEGGDSDTKNAILTCLVVPFMNAVSSDPMFDAIALRMYEKGI